MDYRADSATRFGEYTGERVNGKMHGFGTMVWPNGMRYEGTFRHDGIYGEGTFYYPDGTVYEGAFSDGEPVL